MVEFGIDSPEKTMMVIMNVERFGIGQRHQFRDHVSRGIGKSSCKIVSTSTHALS